MTRDADASANAAARQPILLSRLHKYEVSGRVVQDRAREVLVHIVALVLMMAAAMTMTTTMMMTTTTTTTATKTSSNLLMATSRMKVLGEYSQGSQSTTFLPTNSRGAKNTLELSFATVDYPVQVRVRGQRSSNFASAAYCCLSTSKDRILLNHEARRPSWLLYSASATVSGQRSIIADVLGVVRWCARACWTAWCLGPPK